MDVVVCDHRVRGSVPLPLQGEVALLEAVEEQPDQVWETGAWPVSRSMDSWGRQTTWGVLCTSSSYQG